MGAAFLFLMGVTGFFWYKTNNLQKSTIALQLKVRSLEKKERKALSWENLENSPDIVATSSEIRKTEKTIEKTNKKGDESKNVETPLADQTVASLTKNLKSLLSDRLVAKSEELENGLRMAEEIISRRPDTYSAHKAKLILLLTMEGRSLQQIDDMDIENLLVEMSSFDFSDKSFPLEEAFIIARENKEIYRLEEQIDEKTEQLTSLDEQMEAASENHQELLSEIRSRLEAEVQELMIEVEEIDDDLESGAVFNEVLPNSDLVEVYLQRLLARGDYQLVLDESANLVEDFPQSLEGYFYIIKTLQLAGRGDEALEFISELDLSPELNRILQHRLKVSENTDPKSYWKRLNFRN